MNILICISGSIAAYKAAPLISLLKKEGHKTNVVVTKTALEFIGKGALEALSEGPVITDGFEDCSKIFHINLTKWADLITIYPASAATIARLSHGHANDLISSIFLASNLKNPVFLCPAMNTEMYRHPAVKKNLEILSQWNVSIIEPEQGRLACGEEGEGRLPEPETILKLIGNRI